MKGEEITRLQSYLQRKFELPELEVRQRQKQEDSAEVYISGEFIGVVYRDDDDEDLSYQFQMAILEMDLD
ncbi:DUF3126 family protein [Dichotomicrobium thermohalophilum]|uniref:Uncharacterized protein DUF3126 n=1 Tax=Dichotomicrobium thermohalophilum TaxID=933063 RepID=A0A397QEI5_9HYPH|nr:DUF3126 family protein [Dichotomicrobium thermohalophilum]RIA56681.1 uncharacterized protein DUF3126 [Dichotomicrobium thermohalophilum]